MNEATGQHSAKPSSEAEALSAAPFATECDLVMKGGITSGIVYPLAITEIAKAFRLRSIGGTSAGAIAAAAAAAAEAGRQRFNSGEIATDPDGFGKLAQLPDHLCAVAASGRGTKLLALFKPKAALRPFFDALTGALSAQGFGGKLQSAIGTLVAHYWVAAAIGVVLGTLPLWFIRPGWSTLPASVWILGLAILLAVGLVLLQTLRTLVAELPDNGFGICSGIADADDTAPEEALTTWLARYFDELAGQAQACPGQMKPLTFGDLKAHGVDLQVMTTCLTMGRPFRLPLRDDDHVRENNQFQFRKTEFDRLFPPYVVQWMVANPRPFNRSAEDKGRFSDMDFTGYQCLPLPDDFPVVVAVRMSLSFPLLLSAIPLHAVDFRKPPFKGEQPERCWFTDGGVGSNFPIHFFDAPLPTRPTFGLDLGLAEDAAAPRVVFPETNGGARLVYWRRFANGDGFSSITGFLSTVVNVAKDWNHEALSHLPGFRDRIGLIRLTKEEGGLNLTMPPERIQRLTEYGREAGQQFVRRFGAPAKWAPGMQASKMNWDNHQRIRLRLVLASVGEMVANIQSGVDLLAGRPTDYGRLFTSEAGAGSYCLAGLGKLDKDPANGLYTTQAGLAKWMLDDLVHMAQRITATVAAKPDATIHPGTHAPKPAPELKLRPRI